MYIFSIFLIFGTISTLASRTEGAIITGPKTNFTETLWKTWLKGSGILKPNKLPDVTYNDKTRQRWPGADAAVGRRFLKNIVADDRQQVFNPDEYLANYYEDKILTNNIIDLINPDDSLEELENEFLAPEELSRTQTEKADPVLVMRERHLKNINDIKVFLESTYIAHNYLHKEIRRIKRDRVILDPLRKMVEHLSMSYMDDLAKSVFNCFKEQRLAIRPVSDVWKHRTPNNLVIRPFVDHNVPGYY